MSKLIAISLNPNIQKVDLAASLRAYLRLFTLGLGSAIKKYEEQFSQLFGPEYEAVSFYSGRAAWYAILSSLGVHTGDEVLIPAFTCVAVVNPIRWLGAKPIYVDVTDDFIMDLHDASKKVTPQTKVILAQHTFGRSVDFNTYKQFAQKHNLKIVEDCAHSLGTLYEGAQTGTLGDVSFFSFGRDKCISAGSGGIALTKDSNMHIRLRKVNKMFFPPYITQVYFDVLYIWLIECIYFLYKISPVLSKGVHKTLLFLNIIKTANSVYEKRGVKDESVLRKWHPVLATLALEQIKRVGEFTKHRRTRAEMYHKALEELEDQKKVIRPLFSYDQSWLRYSVLVDDPVSLRTYASNHGVVLGDWYDQVVGPKNVNLSAIGYENGSCPHAEELSKHVVNLPTGPRVSEKDAEKVIEVVKDFFTMTNDQLPINIK